MLTPIIEVRYVRCVTSNLSVPLPESPGEDECTRIPLSAFRRLDRLPGAVHPAVYRVEYDCACGDVHLGLVSHSDLDYGPLAPVEVEFRNLLTGRTEPVGDELAEVARSQVQRGNWPWRLYCSRESTAEAGVSVRAWRWCCRTAARRSGGRRDELPELLAERP